MVGMVRPNAEDVRKVVEDRLAAAEAIPGQKEAVTVEWRGRQTPLPVITMPTQLLAYNPDTHRVRAQRSLDPLRDQNLEADPYGDKAQAYLHNLLMGDPTDPSKVDPAFEVLRDDLGEHGQNDPGIIDRTGVLVNGNTRCAALRELGQEHIRVAVLPEDAGLEDVQAVELSLQLRKDRRRDYSFMNTLLAIDERVKAGWSPEKIQREFRIKAPTFERYRWILSTVQEMIARSSVPGADGEATSLRLVDFETHQGKLEELQRKYATLKAQSGDDAEALREQRMLAIALEKSKTDVRLIEHDFATRHRQVADLLSKGDPSAPVLIPGTTITTTAPSQHVQSLKELTTQVLQAKATSLAPPSVVTKDQLCAANECLGKVDEALDDALDQAGRSSRLRKTRLAPVDRLSDANDDLQLTLDAIAEARATGSFEPGDLDDSLVMLRGHLQKMAQLLARAGANGGDGFQWLKQLVTPADGAQ